MVQLHTGNQDPPEGGSWMNIYGVINIPGPNSGSRLSSVLPNLRSTVSNNLNVHKAMRQRACRIKQLLIKYSKHCRNKVLGDLIAAYMWLFTIHVCCKKPPVPCPQHLVRHALPGAHISLFCHPRGAQPQDLGACRVWFLTEHSSSIKRPSLHRLLKAQRSSSPPTEAHSSTQTSSALR